MQCLFAAKKIFHHKIPLNFFSNTETYNLESKDKWAVYCLCLQYTSMKHSTHTVLQQIMATYKEQKCPMNGKTVFAHAKSVQLSYTSVQKSFRIRARIHTVTLAQRLATSNFSLNNSSLYVYCTTIWQTSDLAVINKKIY